MSIKHGFKLVFYFYKFTLTKWDFCGKGLCSYAYEGLFKLNVKSVNNHNASSFVYTAVSCDVWHARLGHTGCSVKNMMNLGLMPKTELEHKTFKVCVRSKYVSEIFL